MRLPALHDRQSSLSAGRAEPAGAVLCGDCAEPDLALGLSPARVRTISFGKERPEALGSDEAAFAQNRRAVSIVLIGS
jgi:outer membrane protein OmpA-like peptidoglycan-associated protein